MYKYTSIVKLLLRAFLSHGHMDTVCCLFIVVQAKENKGRVCNVNILSSDGAWGFRLKDVIIQRLAAIYKLALII